MPSRVAPQLSLACFVVRDGELAVLASLVEDRRRPVLPGVPVPQQGSLEATAAVLARSLLGRSLDWSTQVGGFIEEGLRLAVAAVAPIGTEAPAGYAWVSLSQLSAAEGRIARASATAVRDRLDREPVAFRLLPPTFTLGELQDVYELLLERRLHKASFRRTLLAAHLVEPTDSWRSEGRGRPAQLFRYSPRKRRGVQRAVRFELLG